MKILLIKDVKGKGKAGDILNVSDSYARNVLIAKGMGVEATSKNMNDFKLHTKNIEKTKAEDLAAAKELAEKLSDKKVVIPIKVGDAGRTFGSVSAKEIGEAVKDQLGLEVDKKKLVLESPIKELGTFDVPYKVHPMVAASIKVEVVKLD